MFGSGGGHGLIFGGVDSVRCGVVMRAFGSFVDDAVTVMTKARDPC